MKKAIAALLTGSMLASLCAAPAGAVYQDAQDHWAAAAIETWSGYGVIQGDNGGFRPNDSITRGEMAAILVRLLGLTDTDGTTFMDVAPDAWYADAIAKCAAAGILKGDNGMARPNDPISRQEAMVMLGRALGIREEASSNKTYLDGQEVADWAAGYVNALTNGGIVGGVGGNQLAPLAEINRASVVTILNNAVTNYVNEPGQTVEVSGDGITVVATSNVTLTGETSGDVLIAAGAAHGSVKLDGLKAAGSVIVTSEGTAVTLTGSAEISGVVVDADAERAQIIVEEDGKADEITVSAPAASVIIKGETDSVQTTGEAGGAQVTVTETGVVGEVNVSSDNTAVAVEGEVSKVTTEAAGTDVSGSGKVESVTAEAGASDVTVSTPKTEITVSDNAESGVTVNDKEVKPGESGTTNNKGNNVVIDKGEGSTGKPSGGSSGGSTQPDYAYYTVTFMDGETVVETQRIREGRTASKPADPVKTGYTFGGWYNGETLYNFDAPVEGSLTLTAKWVANPQTITLVCTETSVGQKTLVVEYDSRLTKESLDSVVAEPGYEVTSWTLNSVEYDFTTPVTGDMTLTYTRQPINYTVTFEIADATVDAVSLPYGGELTSSLPKCDATGFTWTWYTDAGFTEEVPAGMTMPLNGVTLYGQWSHDASGLKGHGSENDPFLIGSAEELKNVNELSKAMINTAYYFELTTDIDLSDSATSDWIVYFQGDLNGNGHTITGFSSSASGYKSIIQDTMSDATIHDLTLEMNGTQFTTLASCVNRDSNHIGTVKFVNVDVTQKRSGAVVDCGNNDGPYCNFAYAGFVEFDNCQNDADFNFATYGALYVGGYAYSDATVSFKNCTNNGNLTGADVALFIGNPSRGPAKVTVADCTNNGTVHGVTTEGWFSKLSGSKVYDSLNSSVTVAGNPVGATEEKVEMQVTKNEDGTITITVTNNKDVSYYLVKARASSSFKKKGENNTEVSGGSSYVEIRERINVGETPATTTTPFGTYLKFVDEGKVEGPVTFDPERVENYVGAKYTVLSDGTVVFCSQDMMDSQASYGETMTSVYVNSVPKIIVEAYNADGVMIGEYTTSVSDLNQNK